ncbi:hypothetical protein WAI453_010808 [Rhynchosporium graminicola]|uniref:Related to U1 SMALL NUCLEAR RIBONUCLEOPROTEIN C n=1 Tax=Rhynchosporium graminicola TaxID=2792576 RepID=A0A1E1L9D4_9HELO|nr:related to U1 SMALL NUCLEAR RIBONUCLEOPROTEIN C [Rhynchosporium commune]
MAVRYTPDDLIFLRGSPLVEKPANLPPAEQWMGQTADAARNSTKPAIDRAKSNDSNLLLDQARRPVAERHMSRNSANPEDIILGPPKNQFSSAARNTGKTFDSSERPTFRDTDTRDRYNFRPKTGDGEAERTRDSRNNISLRPKRADGEDSDGWSTVKPRKSFGTEGAERFNGRMGVDRNRDERRNKDREERDVKEKPRGFDSFSRDKDNEHDQDRDVRRNGNGRGRNESWFKDKDTGDLPPSGAKDRNSNGDRFVDRSRGWREKERDDNRGERGERNERTDRNDRNERGGDRGDRRWDRDRDQRQEREPAWFDEPAEDKSPTNQIHTADDFQKWKEQQRSKDLGQKAIQSPMDEPKPDEPSFFSLEKPKVETPLEMSNGPDKFFGMWSAAKEGATPDSSLELKTDGAAKSKIAIGKASRFTSFFTPQEDPQGRQTEPAPPPPQAMPSGLAAFFLKSAPAASTSTSNSIGNSGQSADPAEREAFQSMLQKLQLHASGGSGSTPPVDPSMQSKPPAPEKQRSNPLAQPEPYQQYRTERPEEPRPSTRNSQQSVHQDLLNQRHMAGSQPITRPEQMLQDLVGQRHSAMSQNSRSDQTPARNTNTEFLMGLMQSARAAPEPQRSEQMLLRMAPRNIDPRNIDRQLQQQAMEREQEMHREAAQRERGASQRQARPQPPPGFHMDDPAFQRGPPQYERQPGNLPQPTQILQRPPPPGLDMGWDRQSQIPPQHRIPQNIAPPPGLANGPPRGIPMPQGIYPPGFPMGAFPPPDVMAGPPRNMQMQPPPGFFPPPGFMPPGMSGFQGPPEGMAFGAPFDARGPPPQGAFRRQ